MGWPILFISRRGEIHDGTDLDAKAVKWNFDHMMDPQTERYPASSTRMCRRLELVDRHTVRFVLQEPNICSWRSSPAIVWVPHHLSTAFETDVGAGTPVTSGGYRPLQASGIGSPTIRHPGPQ